MKGSVFVQECVKIVYMEKSFEATESRPKLTKAEL